MEPSPASAELIAFFAESKAELAARVRAALDQASDPSVLAAFAEKSRRDFCHDAPVRLLAAAAEPGGARKCLAAALQWLEKPGFESLPSPPNVFFGRQAPPGKLAFLFPGQGSQYLNMGLSLLDRFEEARAVFELAENAFNRNPTLCARIYPGRFQGAAGQGQDAEEALRDTAVVQPAIGAVSLLMARILERHEIVPDAAAGHSFGELTALCCAGRLAERDFMKLAVARGNFMALAGKAAGENGRMLAVRAPAEKIEALIERHRADVVLANRNSPVQAVLSGPADAIGQMEAICRRNRIITARLPVSAAFHSRLVAGAAEPFRRVVADTAIYPGAFPVYANTTGKTYPGDAEEARRLLGRHLACPVDFVDEIRQMHADGIRTFVEVGPKAVLTGLVKSILSGRDHAAFAVDGSAGRQPAVLDMAGALCRLAAMGYRVRLARWPGGNSV